MKAYIITIAVSTVVCAVINMLTPEKWTKYVGVVTGLVVMLSVAQPVTGLINHNLSDGFSYTARPDLRGGEAVMYNEIKTQLEARISEAVRAELKDRFGKDCQVETVVAMRDDGEETGISSIYVYGDRIDAVAIGSLREEYGAEEVKYLGIKKTP